MSYYLLTGTAGFIGQQVAILLLQAGHTVIGLDNLNDAYDLQLKHWRLQQLNKFPNFKFYLIDIAQRSQLQKLFEETLVSEKNSIEAIFNLAARAGVRQSVENPLIYIDTNITGTQNLLDCAIRYQIPKFILASTSSLYGNSTDQPYHEEKTDTNKPLSPYAASKKAAEALCYTYHHLYGLDIAIFRYFTVYGPAGRPDMSPFRFVQSICEEKTLQIYGDGKQERDFTFVHDIALGTIAGLGITGYEVINLGSDQPVPLMEIIHQLETLAGKQAKLEFSPMHKADVRSTWADIGKAKQLLNWRPQTKLEDGLKLLYQWYCRERSWAKDIDLGYVKGC